MSILDGDFTPTAARGGYARPHGNLGILKIAVVALFLLLTLRLADMQIRNGGEYARRSRENHIRAENILPARGLILGRDGTPLVQNVGIYMATVIPEFLPESPGERNRIYLWLEENLGVPALEVRTRVTEAEKRGRPDLPITVQKYLSREQALTLEEAATGMPGLALTVAPGRAYVGGEAFSHLLGYIGPQDPAEAGELARSGYAPNEPVGKTGIEAFYEAELRGESGFSAVEQDAHGKLINVLKTREPTPGNSLRLAIDPGLQAFVADLLTAALGDAQVAAAVVMNPKTGAVYALVSLPTYDNNLFSEPERRAAEYATLASDPRHPFLNQALSAAAPGSTFKLVTAAAGLQEGNITPATSRDVSSKVLEIKGENGVIYPLYDWRAHGLIDLYGAIAWSSNIYFYMTACGIPGEARGLARGYDDQAIILGYYARAFGLGGPTGIDAGGEMTGTIPSPEYKKRTHTGPGFNPDEREWYYADTCFMGIGQQDVTATPLQIARMTAAIANGGNLVTPHLVTEVIAPGGSLVRTVAPETKRVPVGAANLEAIRQGMLRSVREGAGSRASQAGMDIAGKTGTAEFGPVKADGRRDEHAWFTGFFPFEDPEVVVTVYFDLGVGGDKAAPIAGQIFRYFDANVDR